MKSGHPMTQVRDSSKRGGLVRLLLFAAGRSSMDVFYLGLAVGFFAISWGLVVACERL
jgi:hypothetical protein